MQHIRPGHHIQGGKYRIERTLGKGQFVISYLAFNLRTQSYVVVKEFFPTAICARNESSPEIFTQTSRAAKEMKRLVMDFINSAVATSGLHHNNIAPIIDIFRENDTAYIVRDYIDGQSLLELSQSGELSTPQVLKYIIRLCHPLGYAHENRIIHLDIKPSNIIIRRYDDEPILIDFAVGSSFAASDHLIPNTDGYTPIELIRGDVDSLCPESDIYALAATLYKALTLITPPKPLEIKSVGGLTFSPNVTPSIQEFIQKAMAFDKSRRFHTMTEFRICLANAFNSDSTAAQSDDTAPLTQPSTPILSDEQTTPHTNPQENHELPELHDILQETTTDSEPFGTTFPNQSAIVYDPKTEIVITSETEIIGGSDTEIINNSEMIEESNETERINAGESKKKSKKSIIIVIIALLLAIGGAAFFFMTHSSDKKNDEAKTLGTEEPSDSPKEVTDMEITIDDIRGSYTGPVNAANSPEGDNGYIEFAEGQLLSYNGQWHDGKMSGQGKVVYRSGDTFTGILDNNSLVKGTLYYAKTGNSYEGTFVDDDFYNGTWSDSSGKIISRVVNGKEQSP